MARPSTRDAQGTARRIDRGGRAPADTDTDGRYAFHVGPGDFELISPRQAEVEPVHERFKVAGAEQIRKDFTLRRLDRPRRVIRGIVRAKAPEGSPIAGAIVIGEPIGANGPEPRGTADDARSFRAAPPRRSRPGLCTQSFR